MMNLPHDILLALAHVSQISDFDSVRSRFFESLNGQGDKLTFEFVDDLPAGVPELRVFPIATLHSSFGYAVIDEAHEPDADERAIFRNAFQFLAVLLENREQARALESSNESFRKQAEESFRESERKLSTLLGNLPGMAYRCKNDEHWTMEFVSSGCLYLTGYKAEKIINNAELSFGDLVHPDDRDRVFEEVRKGIENQQSFLLEYRIRDKAGNERWIWEQAREVDKDSDGGEIMEGFIMDITERKKSEARLAHSHELMQYIIEHSNGAVAVHDCELKYVYVSHRYIEDYKLQGKKIIGEHHYDVFPDLPQKWKDVHQKALNGEVSKSERDPFYRADGTVEWTRWECRPWYDAEGAIGGFIIYTEVITERVLAEEELHRLKDHLEQEVSAKTRELKKRVAELERFHDATIEREFRIKELRDEIDRLKSGET